MRTLRILSILVLAGLGTGCGGSAPPGYLGADWVGEWGQGEQTLSFRADSTFERGVPENYALGVARANADRLVLYVLGVVREGTFQQVSRTERYHYQRVLGHLTLRGDDGNIQGWERRGG